MPVLIGTSGWQHRDWRGVLYLDGLAQRRWLECYANQYATVENNGAFYRLPSERTFADWRARTPEGFVMAVKASRYLTHVRRLRDPAEPVGRLLRAAVGLGDRLGPVLLQLPPNFPADAEALDGCLREFAAFRPPAGAGTRNPVRIAVEEGRASNPNLRIGICGEHGGDPDSIHFCNEVGLDYVSCSPFRIPVARLEAGRAALETAGSDTR